MGNITVNSVSSVQAIERMKGELSSEGSETEKEVKLEFLPLDLASLTSVKQFTVAFQERNLPLHILINNAGIAWMPLGKFSLDYLLTEAVCVVVIEKTEDGHEIHMQVCDSLSV